MFEKVRAILSADEIKIRMPLDIAMKKLKEERDALVKDIIAGRDKRTLFIIGPCSADNEDAVCDYASRLARVADKVKDKLILMPRIYTNKPRTRGEGYKGMLHSPDPRKGTDIQAGIMAIRNMHLRVISESGLTGADEMLYPDNFAYLDDVLSYVAVGARSVENQQHRLVASGIDVPVGLKNSMNGSLTVLANSIYAAQLPNEFKYGNNQVRTNGNEYAHAILRGSVDIFGNNLSNYHFEDIIKFYNIYGEQGLKNPAIVIDTNHSNSGKNPFEQRRIVREVMSNMRADKRIASLVKGFMVESYIADGNQDANGGVYGKSITDACIGWEKTESLIYEVADNL
jgi:3-deoxy-7-phosphoheptulonate synthase